MREICSSKPPVVTGICDPNKSQARHHRSLKLSSKLKYLSIIIFNLKIVDYLDIRLNFSNSTTYQRLIKQNNEINYINKE